MSLYRVIDDLAEFIINILWTVMISISVGRLHDHVICSIKDRRIVEKRLIPLTDIAREDYVPPARIAEQRKAKGLKLNYPEAVAYIADYIVEGAREGKSVAALMQSARAILKRSDVMEGVPELVHTVQAEATFPDGTKLVTVHDPIQ